MKRQVKDWQSCLLGWLEKDSLKTLLPEVETLKNCPQSPIYHAEGNAFVHTLLAVEALSSTSDERVFWATLLHDIGKAKTTETIDGQIRSIGHQNVGAKDVPAIMERMELSHLAADVAWLVQNHHFALSWGGLKSSGLTKSQRKFCQHELFPLLIEVARADDTASQGKSEKGVLLENVLSKLGEKP